MSPISLFAFRTPWIIGLVACVAVIVYIAWATDARPSLLRYRGRRLERVTLALAMLPLLAGLVLAYMAVSRGFAEVTADIQNGRLLDVGHSQSEQRLQSV